jgi:hypothetical protein
MKFLYDLYVVALMLGLTLTGQAAITWSFKGNISAEQQAEIKAAMNTAVSNYNAFADYSGHILVTYNGGVPTAQTDGYHGLIEFGKTISARAAQHEIAHWMGCGTYRAVDWHQRYCQTQIIRRHQRCFALRCNALLALRMEL